VRERFPARVGVDDIDVHNAQALSERNPPRGSDISALFHLVRDGQSPQLFAHFVTFYENKLYIFYPNCDIVYSTYRLSFRINSLCQGGLA
jgi:hypothetical protein